MREYQQSRVYDWEQHHVPKGEWIPFGEIQTHINHLWDAMGLKFPPRLEQMPKQNRKWAGAANRDKVQIPIAGCSTRTLLHELAHTMTMNLDGLGHQHNEFFVGMYIVLIERFLRVAAPLLHYTAKISGVNSTLNQTPSIADTGIFYKENS